MTLESPRLASAQQALVDAGVLERLRDYNPRVVSTIWVGLDTEASDIDVVCVYKSAAEFAEAVAKDFHMFAHYSLSKNSDRTLVQFEQNGFLIEIYACATPVTEQAAYRHFKVMERLVALGGERFQKPIRCLKNQGLKTEPAIAKLLNLSGNPYQAVLELYKLQDSQLITLLSTSAS